MHANRQTIEQAVAEVIKSCLRNSCLASLIHTETARQGPRLQIPP